MKKKMQIIFSIIVILLFFILILLDINGNDNIIDIINRKYEITRILLYTDKYAREITQSDEILSYSRIIYSETLHQINKTIQDHLGDSSTKLEYYVNKDLLISIEIFCNPDYSVLSRPAKNKTPQAVAMANGYYWFIYEEDKGTVHPS